MRKRTVENLSRLKSEVINDRFRLSREIRYLWLLDDAYSVSSVIAPIRRSISPYFQSLKSRDMMFVRGGM